MFDLPYLLSLASQVRDLLMQAICWGQEEAEVQAAPVAQSVCWQQGSFYNPSDADF